MTKQIIECSNNLKNSLRKRTIAAHNSSSERLSFECRWISEWFFFLFFPFVGQQIKNRIIGFTFGICCSTSRKFYIWHWHWHIQHQKFKKKRIVLRLSVRLSCCLCHSKWYAASFITRDQFDLHVFYFRSVHVGASTATQPICKEKAQRRCRLIHTIYKLYG